MELCKWTAFPGMMGNPQFGLNFGNQGMNLGNLGMNQGMQGNRQRLSPGRGGGGQFNSDQAFFNGEQGSGGGSAGKKKKRRNRRSGGDGQDGFAGLVYIHFNLYITHFWI